MSDAYYLHKVKHELCFVNKISHLKDTIYTIDMPVVVPFNKLRATDGRLLLQRIIFQHLNSNSAHLIGFMRGMITICSEPNHFQTHLMLSCSTDQLSEPTETEWIAAVENGLDTGSTLLPTASMGSDVKINAWGINNYIYDVTIELWPSKDEQKTFICDCLIKYIKPEENDLEQELDFDKGFNFLIFSKKTNSFIPFLIKSEDNPFFFLNDCEILDHSITINEDQIGRELFVRCKVTK
jgi:hypothetical protein